MRRREQLLGRRRTRRLAMQAREPRRDRERAAPATDRARTVEDVYLPAELRRASKRDGTHERRGFALGALGDRL
jgi:hypothetical protein